MEKFIAKSKNSKNALKTLQMASTLPINILIYGEKGVGKKSLVKEVFPDNLMISINQFSNLIKEEKIDLSLQKKLILTDIEKIYDPISLFKRLSNQSINFIAITTNKKSSFDEFFSLKIELLPLKERVEDLEYLKKVFLNEAKNIFNIDIDIENFEIDLSSNAISLKKSIYESLLFSTLDKKRLINLLQDFLEKELEKDRRYEELLEIFEIPLLNAAKKKYKSKLQMAKHLKLNRATLKKKIDKYRI